MFFARLRSRMWGPRAGYLFLFIVVFLMLLVLTAGMLWFVRTELEQYCNNDVAVRLEKYLQAREVGIGRREMGSLQHNNLQGLEFVRLISAREQLFFSEGPDVDLDFQKIVNLDPGMTATWVSLDNRGEQNYWTIRSKRIGDGRQIQAGMRHVKIVALYANLKKGLMFMLLPALLTAAGITLFCRSKSLHSLAEAEKSLSDVVAGKSSGLLQEDNNSELHRLYQLLNKLISQNNQ